MKFFLFITTFLILTLPGNVFSQSFPNPATLSTGQGAVGSNDPLWLVSPWYTGSPPNPMGGSYSPASINNNCAPGAWVDPAALPPPVNNGNWITGADAPCTGIVGYRYFRLTIDLPPDCNGNSVTTAGNYVLYLAGYADNGISDVFINGNSTGISGGGFSAGTQLNMTLIGPWVTGINYVDVLLYNGGGPYGLLLVANSTASANADGDGDGVSDLNDQCPCQPGSLANGCPASITGDTIICNGESTTLTATGSGTYLWNTGSTNASVVVSPAAPTSYYVLVTTSSGFIDSAAINVSVNPLPQVSITGDTLICSGELILLTASGGGTYLWNTGSTNSSITATPASSASYKVVVISANGCKDSISQNVTVFPKPEADFTFTNQCMGTAIPFNNSSIMVNPDVIVSWEWDFGDNTFSFDEITSHTYNNAGNYNVNLIVTSNNSCSDTSIQQITVFNNPLSGFTHNDVCLGDTLHFTNTSSVQAPASVFAYLWTFGDSSPTGNQQHPNHYYTNAGTYNVTLVTSTTDGCSDTLTIPVNTFDPPESGFTFNATCLFDSAIFMNTTLNPIMGSVSGWSWDFGDATALNTTAWDINHLYASPGNYEVTLITYSSNLGCPDTLQNTITVFPMPLANFTSMDVCLNQEMNFNDLSVVPNNSISGWSWAFGDGSPPGTVQYPVHNYANPGTYVVSLIATTNNACKDTITKSVVVHPLPLVQFSTSNVCLGNSTSFTDLSSIPISDTIQSQTWDFGDNSPQSTIQNTSHLYTGTGLYNVRLVVASTFGCIDSISKTSIVNPNPTVLFTANDTAGCAPLCISFQDISTISPAGNLQRVWNLGDGSATNNSQAFDHCYINNSGYLPSEFQVSLTVTSDSGCVSTLTKNSYIIVYPNPDAGFTVQPQTTSIVKPVVLISDLSVGADFWSWDFGDSSDPLLTSLSINSLPYTYADTGTYTIMLVTSTQYGCVDTAYETISIAPEFIFYIPNAFTPDGDGINDSFSGKGLFISEYEMTIFDRWGNLIFFSVDVNKPWDGRANLGTEIAQGDVYIYSIQVTDLTGKKHNYKGIVTLLR